MRVCLAPSGRGDAVTSGVRNPGPRIPERRWLARREALHPDCIALPRDTGLRAVNHLKRPEDAFTLAIVHVRSHSRHLQQVVTVMTFASVSMILLVQNGHCTGRVTSPGFDSGILVCPQPRRA